MGFTLYPYLDELAWRLRELPEMQALLAANNYGQSVTQVVRHISGLGPEGKFNVDQRRAGIKALKRKVERNPSGIEAVMAGFDAIEAALTPDVVEALCRALAPDCVSEDSIALFAIWSEKEVQLHETLFNIVFARMFRYDEPFNELLAQLRRMLS
jgi:hypothetical protein